VQSDWLTRTEEAVRKLSDDLRLSDVSEFARLLHRSIDRLEGAPDRLHSALLSLRLLDVCRTIVETIHAIQPSTPCSCHAAAWAYLPLVTRLDDDPRIGFLTWVDRFLAHAVAEHPSTPAQTAAALMRVEPARAWTLRDLGNRIGAHQGRLSREFERLFHMRPGEYLHLVRVSHAVAMFRTPTKVEVIASDVGYRSK
jgi:AraC-like DNA-binding protein